MIHDLVHEIEKLLGATVAAVRTKQSMTKTFVCGDDEVKLERKTLGRAEHAVGSTTSRTLILSSSRMNVHPAVFWNFPVEGNALFNQLNSAPCPFLKDQQCYFCYNQTNHNKP